MAFPTLNLLSLRGTWYKKTVCVKALLKPSSSWARRHFLSSARFLVILPHKHLSQHYRLESCWSNFALHSSTFAFFSSAWKALSLPWITISRQIWHLKSPSFRDPQALANSFLSFSISIDNPPLTNSDPICRLITDAQDCNSMKELNKSFGAT